MVRSTPLVAFVTIALLAGPAAAADRPFYPSALNTGTGMPIRPDDFTPAKRCAYCHPYQYEQWRGSMHANAFADPLYQAAWKAASKDLGSEMDNLCAGCHTPVGTVSEQVWIRDTGEIVIHPRAEEGVTCDFCHSVVRVDLLERNGDPGNAGLVVAPGEVKRGPYADATSPFHETAYSELHTRSELCGACHNIFHPISGTPIARTYEEWETSPYARAGIQCQDCHMVPPKVAAQVASQMEKPALTGVTSTFETERTPFFHHTFTGANRAVPELLGHAAHGRDAELRLKIAARLRMGVPRPPVPGGEAEVDVKVHNLRAGHNLPTSMTELRQMWLQVVVTDVGANGRVVWESGTLDRSGALDPRARRFGALAVDELGRATWKPWKVARIVQDTSIPPRAEAIETYRFPVPEDARGPLRVEATLRYRSFPQKVADEYLGKPGYRVPVIDMASNERTLFLKTH